MQTRRNPAVYAGLALALAPRVAYAATPEWVSEVSDALRSLPALVASEPMAVAAGAAGVALVVAGTVAHTRSSRSHAEIAQGAQTPPPADDQLTGEVRQRTAASTYKPRHMSVADWESTGVIRVNKGGWDDSGQAPKEKVQPQAKPQAKSPSATPYKARHFATDLEDVATNYVERQTFSQRMARRASGVAEVLRERLGEDMMDGLPVIARADGSVGDVGTDWWNKTVGFDAIEKNPGYVAADFDAIPSDFTQPGVAAAWEIRDGMPATASVDTSVGSPSLDAAERSRQIASRLPFIDEGTYPEERTVEEAVQDPWDRALKAMDEKLEAVPQVPEAFSDAAGDEDSIDDPDGLEPDTLFMNFRVPAGHPEVTDTGSYVDYLISEEFSHNESQAARRSSREFLTMLDGGATNPLDRGREGRHFAAVAEG